MAAMIPFTLGHMQFNNAWTREVLYAVVALAVGFGVMPALIYWAGVVALGKYEGASVGRIFEVLYAGLLQGSLPSWGVVLGPYVLYLIFKAAARCWQWGARAA